jgi:uncharacterized membrane protein
MPRWFRRKAPAITETARKNLESVAQIEQEYDRQRTTLDRVCDAITRFAGSFYFIAAHALWFAAWITLNSLISLGIRPFDPYPFSFINLVIVVEAFFLSTFILMSQNRQTRRTDHWAHLHLQIGMLAEQEATKMLQLLQALCDRAGLEKAAQDKELKEMIEITEVAVLAQEMKKVREPDEGATGESH